MTGLDRIYRIWVHILGKKQISNVRSFQRKDDVHRCKGCSFTIPLLRHMETRSWQKPEAICVLKLEKFKQVQQFTLAPLYIFWREKEIASMGERGWATKISYKGLLSCLEISIITITHCIDHVPLPHTWPDRSISSIIIVLNLRGKIIMWNGKYWYNGIKLNVKQSEK